jgi:hypothetical protein
MVSGHEVTLLPGELIALAQCLRRDALHDDYLPRSGRWQSALADISAAESSR